MLQTNARTALQRCARGDSIVAETDAIAVVPRAVAMLPAFEGQLQVMACPIPLLPLPVFAFWHESFDADPGHVWLRGFLTERFWAEPPPA